MALFFGENWLETIWRIKSTQAHLGWRWGEEGIKEGEGEVERQLGRGRSQCGNVCPGGDSFLKDDVGVSQEFSKDREPTGSVCVYSESFTLKNWLLKCGATKSEIHRADWRTR